METITLNNQKIKYELTFKKNKNTYFYFKKEGYIKINASTFQTKKQIINHMTKNSDVFISKLNKAKKKQTKKDPSAYYLWGTKLQVKKEENLKTIIYNEDSIHVPKNNTDQANIIKTFEKNLIIEELHKLKEKYLHNNLIDISQINIKTRYTKTRFGSCNAHKKNININTNLIHYDKSFIEYVFLHEICHLTYQDHSINFYSLLQKLSPNYKQLRKELRNQYQS